MLIGKGDGEIEVRSGKDLQLVSKIHPNNKRVYQVVFEAHIDMNVKMCAHLEKG